MTNELRLAVVELDRVTIILLILKIFIKSMSQMFKSLKWHHLNVVAAQLHYHTKKIVYVNKY